MTLPCTTSKSHKSSTTTAAPISTAVPSPPVSSPTTTHIGSAPVSQIPDGQVQVPAISSKSSSISLATPTTVVIPPIGTSGTTAPLSSLSSSIHLTAPTTAIPPTGTAGTTASSIKASSSVHLTTPTTIAPPVGTASTITPASNSSSSVHLTTPTTIVTSVGTAGPSAPIPSLSSGTSLTSSAVQTPYHFSNSTTSSGQTGIVQVPISISTVAPSETASVAQPPVVATLTSKCCCRFCFVADVNCYLQPLSLRLAALLMSRR